MPTSPALPACPARPCPPPRSRPSSGALVALALLCGLGGLLGPGCSGPSRGEAEVLRLAPARYAEAFSTAAEVLSDHGLSPAVRDRRAGVIETDPEASAGWFAPWNLEFASSLEGVATLSTVRRRARVSFIPEAFDAAAPDAPLTGPDLFGLREPPPDVGQATTPIEMRVAIYVERSHRPGLQVDTWSRRLVTQARVGRPSPGRGFEPFRTWWPVARDAGLERAILQEIAARMDPAS